jgi:hypothetical protein
MKAGGDDRLTEAPESCAKVWIFLEKTLSSNDCRRRAGFVFIQPQAGRYSQQITPIRTILVCSAIATRRCADPAHRVGGRKEKKRLAANASQSTQIVRLMRLFLLPPHAGEGRDGGLCAGVSPAPTSILPRSRGRRPNRSVTKHTEQI